MTAAEAAKILELPADADSDRIEFRFLELRRKLEDKIAKAPTPGLQAKYREALAQLIEAFETLTLAADGSDLPMLRTSNMEVGASASLRPESGPLHAPAAPFRPAAKRKSGGREFAVVAVVAVLLLAAGGWFIMKTRAEAEEKARITAEQSAAAARKAEAERAEKERIAAADRMANEEERARLAEQRKAEEAERKANDEERARVDRLIAEIRTKLVEARAAWNSYELEERRAEREASDLKSELQSQRDGPVTVRNELAARGAAAQRYADWLAGALVDAPPRLTLAKIDELLSARLADDAKTAMVKLAGEFSTFAEDIKASHDQAFALDGQLDVDSEPTGLRFEVVDAFGRRHEGVTPASIKDMAPGPGTLTLRRPQYADRVETIRVQTGVRSVAVFPVRSPSVTIRAEPDVEIWSGGRLLGRGQFTLEDHPPNEYQLELRRRGFRNYAFKVVVPPSGEARFVDYRFSDLAAQSITCDTCEGRGYTETEKDCSACNGRGRFRCDACNGRGNLGSYNGRLLQCFTCGGRGWKKCQSCNGRGTVTDHRTCIRCGGDGRLSKLDLQ